MKKLDIRRSEIYFGLLGLIMAIVSTTFLFGSVSFVRVTFEVEDDPFAGTYAPPNLPPPQTEATPIPAQAQPYATPILDSNGIPYAVKNLQKAYLIYPASHAILTKTGNIKRGFPVKFKFEVDPKDTPCKFILVYDGEVVIEKSLKGSQSGAYTVPLLLRKPGLYTWQIKTAEFKSEKRELIIKE